MKRRINTPSAAGGEAWQAPPASEGSGISRWVKRSPAVHLFTNLLCGNSYFASIGNRMRGSFAGLMIRCGVRVRGRGNTVHFGAGCTLRRTVVYIEGNGNTVTVGAGASLCESQIWIKGDGNTVTIDDGAELMRCECGAEHNGNRLTVRERARIGGFVQLGWRRKTITKLTRLYCGEGTALTVGTDCAVSDNAELRTSDSHPVYDARGVRTNHARDIVLGAHTLICSGAVLLKGARTGSGCVVGAGALVAGDFSDRSGAVIAGVPARVVKEDIRWEMKIDQTEMLP